MNTNNPNEWFEIAMNTVSDEAVFSEDQITALRYMLINIRQGVNASLRNQDNRRVG